MSLIARLHWHLPAPNPWSLTEPVRIDLTFRDQQTRCLTALDTLGFACEACPEADRLGIPMARYPPVVIAARAITEAPRRYRVPRGSAPSGAIELSPICV